MYVGAVFLQQDLTGAGWPEPDHVANMDHLIHFCDIVLVPVHAENALFCNAVLGYSPSLPLHDTWSLLPGGALSLFCPFCLSCMLLTWFWA